MAASAVAGGTKGSEVLAAGHRGLYRSFEARAGNLNTDSDKPDFVTRLVDTIRSAMGIGAAPDGRPKRRNIYLGAAAIMLALWGWSLTPVIQNWNNPNDDGFSLIPGSTARSRFCR